MQQSRDRMSARCGTTACALGALVALVAILFLSAGAASAARPYKPITYYVNVNAEGANNGTSWANAFTDLQDALDAAVSGDAIWVAAGTYRPDVSDRKVSFALKSGVALYGGFAGSETALSERSSDPGLMTVLSGDIGMAGDDTDNSYHVVFADGVTDAVLDGFTVTLGRADGEYGRNDSGGGLYSTNSLLTVSNCVLNDNKADYAGGGLFSKDSALTVTDSVFSGNAAGVDSQHSGQGGGMYNEGQYTDPESPVPYRSSVIRGCTFRDNRSYLSYYAAEDYYWGGAGLYTSGESRPTIDRCTFRHNVTKGSAHGGGMHNNVASPTVTNSVFDGNEAYFGGAVANIGGGADILNCTFYVNSAKASGGSGGAVYLRLGRTRIVDAIFSGNAATAIGGGIRGDLAGLAEATITRCLFHENYGNNGEEIDHYQFNTSPGSPPPAEISETLLDVDPLLADPVNGNFHLLAGSPAIDAGVTRKYAEMTWLPLPEADFEGDSRVIDGDGLAGNAADIGADEYVPTLDELRALIQGLPYDQIDGDSAIVLLDFVDDAQDALDGGHPDSAKSILAEMIDWLKALEDTETTELILRKAEAVYGTFD